MQHQLHKLMDVHYKESLQSGKSERVRYIAGLIALQAFSIIAVPPHCGRWAWGLSAYRVTTPLRPMDCAAYSTHAGRAPYGGLGARFPAIWDPIL